MRFSTCHQMRIYLDLVRGMTEKEFRSGYDKINLLTVRNLSGINTLHLWFSEQWLRSTLSFSVSPREDGNWQLAESRESRGFTPSFLVVIGTVELLWARQLIEPFPAISCWFGGSSVGPFTPSPVWCFPVMLQHTALTTRTYRGAL